MSDTGMRLASFMIGEGMLYTDVRALGLVPVARGGVVPSAPTSGVAVRRRRLPPMCDLMLSDTSFPSAHCISVISNPPRVLSPLTCPEAHASGNAGSR